jgi:hypothetical protein
MTAEEKVRVFKSVEALIAEIKSDRFSNDILKNRYAVRFIMLDNFSVFQKLSLQLTTENVNTFGLETLLSYDNRDRWITHDELKNCIKQINSSTIISPFSEIVRFYNEEKFTAFFNEIALLENPQDKLNRRIYIPLVGLKSRFIKFLSSFGRIEESAPIWAVRTGVSQPVTIYLTPSTDSANGYSFPKLYRGLETMYDWLLFWKTKAPTEKIICSSLPINVNYKYSQPDNIFDIKPIKTAFEFITQFLKIQVDIEYKTSDEYFWIQLLSLIDSKKGNDFSFKAFVKEHFNIHKFTIEDILNKWIFHDTTDFDRWLLKHYYLQFISNNDYLNRLLRNCVDYSALRLFREIALSIFVDMESQNQITERHTLLNLFAPHYKLPESDLSEIKEQVLHIAKTDTSKAISLCSGRFDFEKELLISWYQEDKLSLSELKKSYPDFVAYLNDLRLDSWVNTYIQTYKKAKIENKYTDDIKIILADKNANENSFYEWYNSNEFELTHELLVKEKINKVYWIDGLGIEYLSLINEIISKSNFQIEKFKIAKTGIPSSTDHNKFEDAIKIEDLDNYIHNNLYQYPQTICKEIEIVKDIFSKILAQSAESTIAIVSDHGLTALSRLVDSKKYAVKASHEGRYIKLDSEETIEDTDYIRHKNGPNNFKVALTHASLNTRPVREVHGGCTPEEILVPFLVISNKKSVRVTETIAETKQQTDSVVSGAHIKKGFEEEELF